MYSGTIVAFVTVVFHLASVWVVAMPKGGPFCEHNGTYYKDGQTITEDECGYLCTCNTGYPMYPTFFCEPLCSQFVDSICESGFKEVVDMVQAGPSQSGCTCPIIICVPTEDNQAGNQGTHNINNGFQGRPLWNPLPWGAQTTKDVRKTDHQQQQLDSEPV